MGSTTRYQWCGVLAAWVGAVIVCASCQDKLPPPLKPAVSGDETPGSKTPSGPSGPTVTVKATTGPLSLDPLSVSWEKAPTLRVDLVKQSMVIPYGGGTVRELRVRAMHNGDQIAFRLSWRDTTQNLEHGVDTYRDGVAMQFPVTPSATPPAPFMGHKGSPVNIWQWRSDWQADLDGLGQFNKRQPAPAGYVVATSDNSILKRLFPRLPKPRTAVIEYVAEGWGTLTRHLQQDVEARGVYSGGHWYVVFRRKLTRSDGSDAELLPGGISHVNFAVWDGGQRQVNGMKSVRLTWTNLVIEKGK